MAKSKNSSRIKTKQPNASKGRVNWIKKVIAASRNQDTELDEIIDL